MLKFIIQKMWNKKWMMVSLLLGNLLLISIAAANPMYSQAVLQRTLNQKLSTYFGESNHHPGKIVVENGINSLYDITPEDIENTSKTLQEMADTLALPQLEKVANYVRNAVTAISTLETDGKAREYSITLSAYSDFAEHINITHGEIYSNQVNDGVIDVLVNERTFVENSLLLGQKLELKQQIKDNSGKPYQIRIAGVFESKDEQSLYWLTNPSKWNGIFVMDESLFREVLTNPELKGCKYDVKWHVILDHTAIQADQAETIVQTINEYLPILEDLDVRRTMVYCQETLEDFLPEANKLNATILVLQIPVLILLAVFIFMVSRQMLEIDQNEISVYKSRGASKGQIVKVYLLQSILLAIMGLVGGIPLGYLVCRILGASNAFLEFVHRSALPVEFGMNVWLFAGGAALFSICTMVLPTFKFANVNIVDHKRKKNRKNNNPLWKKLFLDVILLLISLYGLYQFRGKEEFLAAQVLEDAPLDPTLYISSSLFMLGAGLLLLRLIPLLVRLVFQIGKRWWSPALYTSFLRILRTNNNQGFLVVFLVLTVSLGIFNTQTARTINANGEERIRYKIGADLVLQEQWEHTLQGPPGGAMQAQSTSTIIIEPKYEKYYDMEGIANVTKVLVDEKVMVNDGGKRVTNVKLMGINTKEFGEIAWFKTSLLPQHWYEYLNAISQNTQAVLVSSNFQEIYNWRVGDDIVYQNANGQSARGIIYGFIDYWPSYLPTSMEEMSDGTIKQKENYLIVAHLSQLQSSWGVTPYQVWIDTEESSQFIYDYAQQENLQFVVFNDVAAEIVAQKNDPIFQGTNGVLTIGFIIVLLLCATGFLIYWILSIQSRTLQFGIFRAMGMSTREILSMLINEQIFISGISVCGGILVGQIAAELFVPLIQIAYSSAEQVIPLEVISERSDLLRLGIVIGAIIIACMAVLCVLISKIKITQALKLGED